MSAQRALLLCALAALGTARVQAAQEPVDADLLEFLGSIGEDDDWQDYLEHKPVKAEAGKPARETRKAPAKSPDASAGAAASKEKAK